MHSFEFYADKVLLTLIYSCKNLITAYQTHFFDLPFMEAGRVGMEAFSIKTKAMLF